MKSLFIALAIAASSFTTLSHAGEGQVSPAVLRAFEKTFTTAQEITWSVTADHFKAHFVMNGQQVTAYYNTDGSFYAITRNISSLQLPITLQLGLKKAYADYWITDLIEMSSNEGTSYYVTVETADTKKVLKSVTGTSWSTYDKSKKD